MFFKSILKFLSYENYESPPPFIQQSGAAHFIGIGLYLV